MICRLERTLDDKVIGYICTKTKRFCTEEQCKVCDGNPPQLELPEPVEPVEMPPLIEEAWNLVKAVGQFICKPGFITHAEYEQRLNVCEHCPLRVERRCSECGCFIDIKAKVRIFTCNKWPSLDWKHISDKLEETLPPETENDRHVHFNKDGSIMYDPKPGYDAPNNINGYKRDSDNPLHFLPLWPPCQFRHQQAVRFPVCGCIEVIMRCNDPGCNQFTTRVGHETCLNCTRRK